MKSSSYFEERSERRMKKMHDKATKCMTKVNKAYDDSLERLKKEIDHIMSDYSPTEKIDYDRYKELLQIYNTTKDKRVKAEAKRLIKENSASYRIQRKEALSKAIEIEKLKQVDSQLSLGGKHLKNVYSSVLNDLGGARVSKKYLDEVLNHEWAGSNFSKRVWHNQDVLAKSLESNLLQSFASGKSNKQIADELEYHTNLGRYAANRLIRTETSYMVNSADLESSKQRGIKAKKFQANLDKRTSKICREHNQKFILIDDIKIGVNAPPLHPFCRSFLSDVLEGWDYETEEELQALVSNDEVETEEVKYTTEQINNVLENYVSGDGMWTNSYLRNPTEFGNLTEDEKEYLSIMDYALKNDIKETTLYRSVDARAVFGNITDSEYDDLKSQLLYGNDNKKALELINSVKGKEIVEKGFMSTTTEQRIALDWGDFSGSDKPIVLELKTPKGTKGKNLHFLDFEDDPQREVLLARNTKYKINSIETKEGQIYLRAEVINDKKGYNIVNTNYNKAVEKVLKHGTKTNTEALMWLDLEGNEIVPFKTGSTNRVVIPKSTINYLSSLEKNTVISLHNHPSSSSFSPEDMNIACKLNSVKEMRVVGHDGTKYFLEIGEGERPSYHKIKQEYENIRDDLREKYTKIFEKTQDKKQTWKEHSNEVNKALAEKFGWNYRRELP